MSVLGWSSHMLAVLIFMLLHFRVCSKRELTLETLGFSWRVPPCFLWPWAYCHHLGKVSALAKYPCVQGINSCPSWGISLPLLHWDLGCPSTLHIFPSHRFHAQIVFFRGQTIRAGISQIKGETEYILKWQLCYPTTRIIKWYKYKLLNASILKCHQRAKSPA